MLKYSKIKKGFVYIEYEKEDSLPVAYGKINKEVYAVMAVKDDFTTLQTIIQMIRNSMNRENGTLQKSRYIDYPIIMIMP